MVNFSNASFVQNVITGNHAGCGGGLHWQIPSFSSPLFVNNTIADNDGFQGSGISADGDNALTKLVNNIVVAKDGQAAVFCGSRALNPPAFRFNNIFIHFLSFRFGSTAYTDFSSCVFFNRFF